MTMTVINPGDPRTTNSKYSDNMTAVGNAAAAAATAVGSWRGERHSSRASKQISAGGEDDDDDDDDGWWADWLVG